MLFRIADKWMTVCKKIDTNIRNKIDTLLGNRLPILKPCAMS